MKNKEYKAGQNEMRERICALIAYHLDIAKRHHGDGSDEHLRYKNLLEDIRIDHENELKLEPEETDEKTVYTRNGKDVESTKWWWCSCYNGNQAERMVKLLNDYEEKLEKFKKNYGAIS